MAVRGEDSPGAGSPLTQKSLRREDVALSDTAKKQETLLQEFSDVEIDDISKLIHESYNSKPDSRASALESGLEKGQDTGSNSSVIYKDEKVFDQPKRAVYGI